MIFYKKIPDYHRHTEEENMFSEWSSEGEIYQWDREQTSDFTLSSFFSFVLIRDLQLGEEIATAKFWKQFLFS
jgi:hypothetical protein